MKNIAIITLAILIAHASIAQHMGNNNYTATGDPIKQLTASLYVADPAPYVEPVAVTPVLATVPVSQNKTYVVSAHVISQEKTMAGSENKNARSLNSLKSNLRQMGVSSANITSAFESLLPTYREVPVQMAGFAVDNKVLLGYTLRTKVFITLHDYNQVQRLLKSQQLGEEVVIDKVEFILGNG